MSVAESFFRTFSVLRQLQLQQEQVAAQRENVRTQFMQSVVANITSAPIEARESLIMQYEESLGIPLSHLRQLAATVPESVQMQQARALATSIQDGSISTATAGARAIGTTAAGAQVDQQQTQLLANVIQYLPESERADYARRLFENTIVGATRGQILSDKGDAELLSDPQKRQVIAGIKAGTELRAVEEVNAGLQQQNLDNDMQRFRVNFAENVRQFNENLRFNNTQLGVNARVSLVGMGRAAANDGLDFVAANLRARGGAGNIPGQIEEVRATAAARTKNPGGRGASPLDKALGRTLDNSLDYQIRTLEESLDMQMNGGQRGGAIPAPAPGTPRFTSPLSSVPISQFFNQVNRGNP